MRFVATTTTALIVLLSSFGLADESSQGHLMIIGGGLLPENREVYERMITYAGGSKSCRFGIFPTASASTAGSERFAASLEHYGVAPAQIQIIDLNVENAERQASSPEIAEQIERCTALFFSGGDQRRITRALLGHDGAETLAFQSIKRVRERGGLVAGTSAGAAVQSNPMIAAAGLPGDTLDQGLDVFDFGLTRNPARRGVQVTRGFGFFSSGLIDQHFSQYRGRLGRLARATIEEQIRYGFGIDENTAMDVFPNGIIEVIGTGYLSIIDTQEAKCVDGPLGCRMNDVQISCLSAGDSFDPKSGTVSIGIQKAPIEHGKEANNGNQLIPDILGTHAVSRAIIGGLGNNTSRTQVGITVKYNQNYGHGYQFTFRRTGQSRSYESEIDGVSSYSVLGLRLKVEPITVTRESPETALPLDLPEGAPRKFLEAMAFRGILLADEERRIRPDAPISRGELAIAVAQTVNLERPRSNPPQIADLPEEFPGVDAIAVVVAARLMDIDEKGEFRVSAPVTRQEAAQTLVRLAETYAAERLPYEAVQLDDEDLIPPDRRESVFAAIRAGLINTNAASFRPAEHLTRLQAAEAIYRIVGFPW